MKQNKKTPVESWLARVEIKEAIDGRAQIYIDGKLVRGVIGFTIEQNSYDKRVPILSMQVQCSLCMESESIPLLPEPWSWFYVPKYPNFVNKNDYLESSDE